MNTFAGVLDGPNARRAPVLSHRHLTSIAGDLLPLLDVLCLLFAASVSTAIYHHWLASNGLDHGSASVLTQAALIGVALAPFMLYDKHFGEMASRGQVSAMARAHGWRLSMWGSTLLALGAVSATLPELPATWLITWLATSVVSTSLTRVIVARHVRRLQRRGALREVVAVVGAGALAQQLLQALRQARPNSVELLGVFDDRLAVARHGPIRSAGTLEQLIELGKTRHIDWIVLTFPPDPPQRLLSTVQRLQLLSAPIALCPQNLSLASMHARIDYVGDGMPMDLLCDRPIKRWNAVVKGAVDMLAGGIATLLLLPVFAAIALAIRLEGPGPILFKQRRHALNNREFDIYKFRTMRWDSATAGASLRQTTRSDDRITRVGRFLRAFSLDELPQLLNVLQGTMSLVGPRPHATNMRTQDRLGGEITDLYAHRHRVKPGITGWAQVNGARGATDTEGQLRRRVELDLHYIDNWSLWLDLKILALTTLVVLRRTNAF